MSEEFQLRPFQKEALHLLKRAGHLICVAPTGSGKSLIFERAIKNQEFRALLVAPLVALARQHHQRFANAKVPSFLGSGGANEEPHLRQSGAWIVSPETLSAVKKISAIERWKPDLLVVDECHCLWEWGESFRPSFSNIPNLLKSLHIERSLWLTATLPPQAREALRSLLPKPLREIGSFGVPSNLKLEIFRAPLTDRIEALEFMLRELSGYGIIFASTREIATRLSRFINGLGRCSAAYHAGLSAEERQNIEAQISKKEIQIVVATSAFGMGMNYLHFEWAILWQAPLSLLSLAQGIGRVGRLTHTSARAIIFWHEDDFRLMEWATSGSERKKSQFFETIHYLSTEQCRISGLEKYFEPWLPQFSRFPRSFCDRCDYCLRRHRYFSPKELRSEGHPATRSKSIEIEKFEASPHT